MNREDAEIKLKRVFGLDHFYDEQWEAIRRILDGERILMIQRTGFGKSLCYQFPATQFSGVEQQRYFRKIHQFRAISGRKFLNHTRRTCRQSQDSIHCARATGKYGVD